MKLNDMTYKYVAPSTGNKALKQSDILLLHLLAKTNNPKKKLVYV